MTVVTTGRQCEGFGALQPVYCWHMTIIGPPCTCSRHQADVTKCTKCKRKRKCKCETTRLQGRHVAQHGSRGAAHEGGLPQRDGAQLGAGKDRQQRRHVAAQRFGRVLEHQRVAVDHLQGRGGAQDQLTAIGFVAGGARDYGPTAGFKTACC